MKTMTIWRIIFMMLAAFLFTTCCSDNEQGKPYTTDPVENAVFTEADIELTRYLTLRDTKQRNAIKALYKEELIMSFEAEWTIKKRGNLYITVYNMEVVLLLAFRLNSYQTRAIRKELMERI